MAGTWRLEFPRYPLETSSTFTMLSLLLEHLRNELQAHPTRGAWTPDQARWRRARLSIKASRPNVQGVSALLCCTRLCSAPSRRLLMLT